MTDKGAAIATLANVGMTYEAWGSRVEALKDVTFDLPRSGLVLVLGANASGKSTLLNIIAGSLRPTAGRVEVLRCDPRQAPARWRASTIAFVGQHPERDLVPEMTVEEHARLFGHSWTSFTSRLSALEPEGQFALLLSCRKQPVDVLSGGQRQSLGLALQLVRDVPLVLLDEPFAALDAERLAAFTGMIFRVAENRCVVNVTHAPEPFLSRAAMVIRVATSGAEVEMSASSQSPWPERRKGAQTR